MNEDQLVQALIANGRQREQREDTVEEEWEYEVEAHYNYYGDRGIVDLFEREIVSGGTLNQSIGETLYEVKSQSAIQSATGANEILRQFNRMREYFYRDENRQCRADISQYPTVSFELVFLPNETTYEHVVENHTLYDSISSDHGYTDSRKCSVRVGFRHPDNIALCPITMFGEGPSGQEWIESVEGHNPAVYSALFE